MTGSADNKRFPLSIDFRDIFDDEVRNFADTLLHRIAFENDIYPFTRSEKIETLRQLAVALENEANRIHNTIKEQ